MLHYLLGFQFYFMYLFLAVLGLHSYVGFPLVGASGGYSLTVVCELLFAVAPLVAEHRPWGMQASVAVACRVSSCS